MFRIIIGAVFGIIISRNAETMPHPVQSAVFLGAILGFCLSYFFGHKDKNIAVATAVATAVSAAKAEAAAQATSQAAVHFYNLTGGLTAADIPSQSFIDAHSTKEITGEQDANVNSNRQRSISPERVSRQT